MKVTIGNSSDIIGKRTMTDFEQVNNNVSMTIYAIELHNSKSEDQNIILAENCNGGLKNNQKF